MDRTATDTIFAPATAPGRAGIAVIRVSGPGAGEALAVLSGGVLPPPRRARRTRFRDPATGEVLEDGLALWFPAPASFTGEDVAELHIHGGRAGIEAVCGALAGRPGLRLAAPGEFARRAFENGKLDLTAVEGLADLVAAETDAQRRQALRQLDGALGRLYEGWRAGLVRVLAHVEAEIDFPDEGLPEELAAATKHYISGVIAEISQHLADNRRGERLRDGLSIAILGAPNVGKSSLLNALARREAAIVAAEAGTTRDVIEVHLDLGGWPVTVADTAGLREAGGTVEREGVRRALARAENADLRIVVFDAAAPPDAAATALLDAAAVAVVNKIDLVAPEAVPASVAGRPAIAVSVRTGQGLDALLAALEARVAEMLADGGAPALTRARHRAALEDCRAALMRAQDADAVELVAEDLRLAARALGRITGRVDVEDVLDLIFAEFCIGK